MRNPRPTAAYSSHLSCAGIRLGSSLSPPGAAKEAGSIRRKEWRGRRGAQGNVGERTEPWRSVGDRRETWRELSGRGGRFEGRA
eukprot:6623022-Pyramimonas_sp.AAC.1